MDREISPAHLVEILANLGREILEPLDRLQANLGTFLEAADPSIPEAESSLARTMVTLCDNLRRLTDECLQGQA